LLEFESKRRERDDWENEREREREREKWREMFMIIVLIIGGLQMYLYILLCYLYSKQLTNRLQLYWTETNKLSSYFTTVITDSRWHYSKLTQSIQCSNIVSNICQNYMRLVNNNVIFELYFNKNNVLLYATFMVPNPIPILCTSTLYHCLRQWYCLGDR
jgi:hypothetical protein